jgi:hypothetical protein
VRAPSSAAISLISSSKIALVNFRLHNPDDRNDGRHNQNNSEDVLHRNSLPELGAVFLFLNEGLAAVAQSDLRVTRPTPEAALAASWIGAKW